MAQIDIELAPSQAYIKYTATFRAVFPETQLWVNWTASAQQERERSLIGKAGKLWVFSGNRKHLRI